MRPKGSAAQLEERRRLAVRMIEQGMTQAKVAQAVGATRVSVYRWWKAYKEGGEGGLVAKPHPGRRPKLGERERERLVRLLLEGARKFGYDTDLWTLPRVTEVIEMEFGVSYHPSQVWRILRGLGWSCQKPERRARERDEEAIRRWREDRWRRIKKSP